MTAGGEGQPHLEHVDEQVDGGQPRAQSREHPLEHRDERRYRRDLPVEPLPFLPERRRRPRPERRAVDPGGKIVGGQARLPQPRADPEARQRGEIAQRRQPPARERRRQPGRPLERGQRHPRQRGALGARCQHVHRRSDVRGHPSGGATVGDPHAGIEPYPSRLAAEPAADPGVVTEQPEAVEIDMHQTGRGVLDTRRDRQAGFEQRMPSRRLGVR